MTPSQTFRLVAPPLLDPTMLECAKAQSLALLLSQSKSTPWWFHSVHGFKYHVLVDSHLISISSWNFSLEIFRNILSTVYLICALGYPISITLSRCPHWTPDLPQLMPTPFQESEMKDQLLEELCIQKRLSGSRCGDWKGYIFSEKFGQGNSLVPSCSLSLSLCMCAAFSLKSFSSDNHDFGELRCWDAVELLKSVA